MSLIDFFGSLFNLEITFFGIFIAALFVFYELVYSKYPLSKFKFLLRNSDLILFTIFIVFSILCSSSAYFYLVYDVDMIPDYNFGVTSILSSHFYGLFCIFLFGISILFFFTFVLNNIGQINPRKIVSMTADNIENESISLYLFKLYGIRSPEEALKHTLFLIDVSEVEDIDEQQLESEEELYNKYLEKIENVDDPFLNINDVAAKSIINYELGTFNEIIKIYYDISERYIRSIQHKEDGWDPFENIEYKYNDLLIENSEFMLNISQYDKIKNQIIEMNNKIIKIYFEDKLYKPIFHIINFWKKEGHKSILNNDDVYKHIIKHLQNIAVDGLRKNDEAFSDVLDQVYRNVGWLGEQLLIEETPVKKPLMMDYEYITNYDSLLECIYSIGQELEERNEYPLIYFDAVHVVVRKIIELYEEYNEVINFDEDIWRLNHIFYSYALNAVKEQNNRGFGLAVLRIYQTMQYLIENKIEDPVNGIVELLIDLAFTSSGNPDLEIIDFFGKDVHEWIFEKMISDINPATIERAVFDRYLSFHRNGDRKTTWQFIKSMGVRLGTNFKLMFDWRSGQDYAPDDPRRKMPHSFQLF
jgi:hypothetical protein